MIRQFHSRRLGARRMRRQIKAYIWMKRPEEGGRRGDPFSADYCPHLRVGPDGEYLPVRVAEIRVSPRPGWVDPGDCAIVRFTLMYPDLPLYDALVEGGEFEILEGARVIGTGEVMPDPEPGRARPGDAPPPAADYGSTHPTIGQDHHPV
jgi:hypothetical protein